jgi:hypothetical protein
VAIEPIGVYNEPVVARHGDRLPSPATVPVARLSAVVKARLELERHLRVCGNRPLGPPFHFTVTHARVLIRMLSELDSPLSAGLRARAAGVVGALRLERAVPLLRRIAIDEDDDIQTRLNAASSLILLRPRGIAGDVAKLLESTDARLRATVYVAAVTSDDPRLRTLAEERYAKEKDRTVLRHVALRAPWLQSVSQTRDDS